MQYFGLYKGQACMHYIPAIELKTCTVNPMLDTQCLLRGSNGLLIPAGSTVASTVVTLSSFSLEAMQLQPELLGFHPPTRVESDSMYAGFQMLTSMFEIRPVDQVLNLPVTVQFSYDTAGLPVGTRRAQVPKNCFPRIFLWKEGPAKWTPISSGYDVFTKLVSAPVYTFGIYAVACGRVDETVAAAAAGRPTVDTRPGAGAAGSPAAAQLTDRKSTRLRMLQDRPKAGLVQQRSSSSLWCPSC